MRQFSRLAAVILFAALLPSSSYAQRFWQTPDGSGTVGGSVAMCLNGTSKAVPCSASVPLQTSGGGGGGGGGDASAANQTSQITQETAINTVLGAKTDAKSTATDGTSISFMQVMKQISASVQAPPTQAVTNAGTFAVQLGATQNTNLANTESYTSRLLSSATNVTAGSALATTSLMVGARYLSTPPTFTNGQEGGLQIDSAGRLITSSAGTPTSIGQKTAANSMSVVLSSDGPFASNFGITTDAKSTATDATAASAMSVWKQISASVQAPPSQAVTNAGTFAVQSTASAGTTGGCTLGKTLSAATTNATSVKGSAGTLCSLTVINTTATLYYLKFYDKATAATCNSDTVIQSIPIPASTTGAGVAVAIGPYGWAFPTGITFCLTGALTDNDNTAAATGVAINYSYK